MYTAVEIFDLAIQLEENGENFYRRAANRAAGPGVKELFRWLADQEVGHGRTFREMRENAWKSDQSREIMPGAMGDALRSAMGRHVFSLDDLEAGSIRDEKELFEAAIVFEEDSIQFFELIASFISEPRVLFAIERIRGEELDHKRLLIEKLANAGDEDLSQDHKGETNGKTD